MKKANCKLCSRCVLTSSITVSGTNLVINIPAGSYADETNYCIITAQNIPSAATINMPVVVTIGAGTAQYPLVKCDCSQVTACGISSRTRYAVRVETTPTGGIFRLQGKLCCVNRDLASINGTAPTTTSTATESEA
jgi:hypothetical protein